MLLGVSAGCVETGVFKAKNTVLSAGNWSSVTSEQMNIKVLQKV